MRLKSLARRVWTPDDLDMIEHYQSRAERLAERLRARLGPGTEVVVVELGAVVGAHVGPGTLAVAVVPRVVPLVPPGAPPAVAR